MRMVRPLILSLAVLALTACNPPQKSDKEDAKATSVSSADDLTRAQELVTGASKGQMRATKVFEGPDGMNGIVTESAQGGGGKQVVWSSENFEIVMPSEAIDKAGEPQNAKFLTDQKVYISGTELASKVADRGFIVGKSGPLISVFMDPNCIYCHKFYNEAAPYIKKGDLRVRYIMVGFLKPDSVPRAATINAASDPAKALDKDEKAFEKGGIAVSSKLTDEDRQRVIADTDLMNSAGGGGTPAIVACQKGAPDPKLLSGMPQDFAGFLANLDPDNAACK